MKWRKYSLKYPGRGPRTPSIEAADGGEAGGEAEAAASSWSWSSLVKSGGGAPGKPPVAPQQGQAPPTQAR